MMNILGLPGRPDEGNLQPPRQLRGGVPAEGRPRRNQEQEDRLRLPGVQPPSPGHRPGERGAAPHLRGGGSREKPRKDRGKAALERVGLAERMTHVQARCQEASSSGWPSPGPWWEKRPLILADEPTGQPGHQNQRGDHESFRGAEPGGQDHHPGHPRTRHRRIQLPDPHVPGRQTHRRRKEGSPVLETLRTACAPCSPTKIRSALTMLGIIIGVAAVITMVAIGAGASVNIQKFISGVGSNIPHRHARSLRRRRPPAGGIGINSRCGRRSPGTGTLP